MNLVIVFSGVAFLIGVALLIGWVQAHAREDAWRRIAEARRDQHERERALLQCLQRPRCDRCPIDRYPSELAMRCGRPAGPSPRPRARTMSA